MPQPFLLTPEKSQEPGSLVVLGFTDENGAFALRDLLSDLEEEGMIEIGDAVVATRNAKGKVRLHQSLPLIAARMAVGSFTGMVMGMVLLNPLFGAVAGAGVGALSGAFGDIGIDDAFMKKLGETLTPGSSALFVVVGKRKRAEMEERLKPFAGKFKVLQTTLPEENEARLRQWIVVEASTPPPSPPQSSASALPLQP
jgi:uncharacterized membrane protein